MARLPSGPAADWPFVGREAELERVARALGRADTTGIVLVGPAGVGKTRLADECLRIAEAAGFATARAVATRAAATIPLGVLAPLVSVAAPVGERRVDLVQAAVHAIAARAADQPLMVVVDDAHLLDEASAAVLHQLTLSDIAFTVATVRADETVSDAVIALWKDLGAERIDLAALDRADTERLVVAGLGGRVDGATLRDLFDASQGNPLYLRELLLGGLEAGLLSEEDGLWRFTLEVTAFPRLADLVEARLAALTDPEREVLELVALGEPLEFDLLGGLADLGLVEALEGHGLVRVVAEDRGARVRLAHPLHGEVVRTGIPRVRAMVTNRRLADAVDAAPSRGAEDVIRLVLWRLEGGGRVEPQLLLDATRRAFFAHDAALAERLARAALEGAADVSSRQLLGEALLQLGRHREAEEVLAAAATEATNDEERALAVMARADTLLWGLGQSAEAAAVIVEAEERVAPGPWRDELTGVRATHELLAGRPIAALDAVEPILATAAGGRPLVEAITAAAPALAIIGRCDDAIALADQGLELRLSLGDVAEMAHPGMHLIARVLALGEAGRLAEADATAHDCYTEALKERRADRHAWGAMMLGRIALHRGHLDAATHWFREGAAVYRDIAQAGPRRWCLAGVVLTSAMTQDRARAGAALAELDATADPMQMMEPDVDRARAWHALVTGEARAGREHLHVAVRRAREAGAGALEAGALHDLARIGSPELAADRLGELAAVVDGLLTAGRAAHARALVARDPSELEDVSNAFEEIGALLFAAEAAAGAAACYRTAGRARLAERCAQRSAALARACEGARTPALALGGEAARLSRREREVAMLAARGVTNNAIADQLVVSVRTVESHLHHAFTKLGVTSRDELAAVLDDPPHDRVSPADQIQ